MGGIDSSVLRHEFTVWLVIIYISACFVVQFVFVLYCTMCVIYYQFTLYSILSYTNLCTLLLYPRIIYDIYTETGEVLNKMDHSLGSDIMSTLLSLLSSIYTHFNDKWNVIDLLTILQVSGWVYYKFIVSSSVCKSDTIAHSFLAMATISLSLGQLVY